MGVPGQLHGKRGKNLGKLVRCPKCGASFKKAELKINPYYPPELRANNVESITIENSSPFVLRG